MMFRGCSLVLATLFTCSLAFADSPAKKRIGLIASLSGFAGSYGSAVKDGVELAISEINKTGNQVELIVEDDQSNPASVISAYRFLKDVKKIEFLVGGSWWVRPLAQITERDGIPFISCETMQDNDFVSSATYFILSGKVSNWVTVYDDLFRAQNMRRGAVVKFSSGFSQAIASEMKRLFTADGREFVGDFEYQDLELSEARALLLRLKRAAPDVVYVDGQPEGVANFLKRRDELGLHDMRIVGHSALETAAKNKLVSPAQMRNVFFLRRKPPNEEFSRRFSAKFGYTPKLSADLGYYAGYMGFAALNSSDPLATLRRGATIYGTQMAFDEFQVAQGISQEIFQMTPDGESIAVQSVAN